MLEELDGVKFPVAINGQHLKKYFSSMWKTSDEADVMHQAMDQHNQGICEESRCDTSGCKST
jgi:hypothetical protein